MERHEVQALHLMFDSDATDILKELDEKPDEQRIRRLFVQTIFSVIEAQISMLRWYMLDGLEYFDPPLNDIEIATLREETSYLSDGGVIETRPLKVALPALYWFTYSTFIERLPSQNLRISKDSTEWREFMQVLAIRDRATHPRHMSDLVVNDDEIAMARRVFGWNQENFGDVAFSAQVMLSREENSSEDEFTEGPDSIVEDEPR
jgi:hypothetical protein